MKPFEIIFENEDLVVVNKSAGLLSIPDRVQSAPSLKDILKEKYGQIFTVHRLDRDTSGLIVFAKNEAMHQFLSQSFESRIVEKRYLGIVTGELAQKSGRIDQPLAEHPAKRGFMVVHKKGKPSSTDFEELETFGILSLVQFNIHTGRTHQIRVHMQYAGHPIVCDELYGDGQPILISSLKKKYKLSRHEEQERPILNRLGLHASQLSFKDVHGLELAFEAPLPKDLKALLQQLRKWTV
jgi:23S rRNA pseudouridine955/2504/2580 synthase/23S rRNA pseudouridine1911/1915/1917 synthase